MTNLCIFVSGNGTNCENLIRHFAESEEARVRLVVSNKPDAFALERARRLNVPTAVVSRTELNDSAKTLAMLREYDIDLIVLAGFLLLVPEYLVEAFPRRIVNLHPALLPAYGGKGMYGHHVHEAVKAAGERETGITVHYVDEHFDHGEIIAQHRVALTPQDSVEDIEKKIHNLEQTYLPSAVERAIRSL